MCYLGVLNGNRDTSYTPPKRFSSNEIAELHEISKFFRDVQFTGDEPTVHRDLPELMDIFSKDPEITISLSTNLFDISDEIIKRLEIGRRQLTISVDTPNLRLYEKIRGVPMSGLLANLGRLPPNPDMKLSLSVVIQKINLMELRTCWNGPL
jgi:MoaA/NifB/PqqE/SkfB family radical SAM enzyme